MTTGIGATNSGKIGPDECSAAALLHRYTSVRASTEALCKPLEIEDYVVQTMPDVSPTKWHLAHTTWFFETFILAEHAKRYKPADNKFAVLFNSYYNAVGPQFPRVARGHLSRPTVAQTMAYRRHVDDAMTLLLSDASDGEIVAFADLLELGLNHEQQHQELILTDIKNVLFASPLRPAYIPATQAPSRPAPPVHWHEYEAAQREIGATEDSFAYDNERPRHPVYVEAFQLASRLVTTEEYLEFIEDGGYERAELWLSDGWAVRCDRKWRAPLYWEQGGEHWQHFTLAGMREVDPNEPVCHVSFYEADAYARWAGVWLPTEAAWEIAASDIPTDGNFVEDASFHPTVAQDRAEQEHLQMFGDVWEWMCSPYVRYPGFRPAAGAIGEYNAKFMSNQMVLRGGSCATPRSHIRATYRNFFPPDARWQFTGIRLSREVQ